MYSTTKNIIINISDIVRLCRENPSLISRLIVLQGKKNSQLINIYTLAKQHAIPILTLPSKKLFLMVPKHLFKGIIAVLSPVKIQPFRAWIERKESKKRMILVCMGGIESIHNFGALLRIAAAFQYHAVLIPSKQQTAIDQALVRASAGTLGHVPIVRYHKDQETVTKLKEKGYRCVALDGHGDTMLSAYKPHHAVALLIGNESQGLKESIKKLSDVVLRISHAPNVESLNVSVSVGICSYVFRDFFS